MRAARLLRASGQFAAAPLRALRVRAAASRNHFRIAAGSAAEVAAILDLVTFPAGAERQHEIRRVVAMLSKLARR